MISRTRRDFIKKSALAASSIPFLSVPSNLYAPEVLKEPLSVHIFSKHLQFLDYKNTGKIAYELGFSGVDLTVRPKGHVLPESVKTDLPRAIADIKAAGSKCELITTSIESVQNPLDVEIIKTAAISGINYYRTHWFKYLKDQSMLASLKVYQKEIEEMGKLNEEVNIIGCYQNHAGTDIGSSFWEIKKILETVNPSFFGTQYDIRHATVEGGYSWQNGFHLLKSHMKVIVLKDFKWGKINGKWEAINTPIGEGMVDFNAYFKLLKKNNLKPPVSLHLEYPLGGAEKGHYTISIDKEKVYDAMKKDLDSVQKLWEMA